MTVPAAFDPDADRLREECGVFGIFGHPDAAAITARSACMPCSTAAKRRLELSHSTANGFIRSGGLDWSVTLSLGAT